MRYYSTNKKARPATLEEAVVNGLAPDRGLYMPERIEKLPKEFFDAIDTMPFQDIACVVADAFFGEDIEKAELESIVRDTLSFDCPVVEVTGDIFSLELFHGPTLAFKDVGARFMARLLRHFISAKRGQTVNVLVATSGDTGSAVANGFLGVDGIHVYVLYPKGKVSKIQECQFTTLGQNITAIEVDGNFDDCQRLVKSAFADNDLNNAMKLTSANSINVARFLPQSFYYFYAYAQLQRSGKDKNVVICVPSGNFGNLAAGMLAQRMGLPVGGFVAASNLNDVVPEFLHTGVYRPRPSVQTPASAMDVGAPSNFERMLWLCGGDPERLRSELEGFRCDNAGIRRTIDELYERYGYFSDPHSAVGYAASMAVGKPGFYLSTAHPAKFGEVIASVTGSRIPLPERLSVLTQRPQHSDPLAVDLAALEDFVAEV